jgi:hypothetical protein
VALSNRLQHLILSFGFLLASVLLIRFAVDFSNEMSLMLALPFWALVLTALSIAALNLFRAKREKGNSERSRKGQISLLAAIPLGFLASTLDCMGLSVEGCTPYCTFIKLGWIPLITLVCAMYVITRKAWLITVISLMAFVTLLPHCVCYNPGNGWWIDRLGASPVCYSWGFVVSVISVGALRPGALYWPSVGVSYAIITGATGFFISHHYLHFPW